MGENVRFNHLLEEGQIGTLNLKNRIKFASTTTCFCNEEGRVTRREKDWLSERAKGGIGLVTTGLAHVTPWGRLFPNMMGGWDDSFITDFEELAGVIHNGGGKACLSISQCGRYAHAKGEAVDASATPALAFNHAPPRQLDQGEIQDIVRAFAEAAGRGQRTGFDAVELCGIAGYLLSSFLSPWTNQRTDNYGGSLENRARFFVEVVDAVKTKVGKTFPVIARLCGDELLEEGNKPEDLRTIAKLLEVAGIDALSIGVGWHESRYPSVTMEIPPGYWLYLAEGMKKVVKIPVMMAYRLSRAHIAEKALEEGVIDFWESSRPFIADPEIPNKLAENRPGDIIPCTGCCQGCFDNVFSGQPIWCAINPRAGREGEPEYQIKTATPKRNIVVIGGGPAGMEAARVAALRDHQVTLLEKDKELGGQLRIAAVPPAKAELSDLNGYLTHQMDRLGIEVKLDYKVTAHSPEVKNADIVILASGADPLIPNMPGATGSNVFTITEVLGEKKEVGEQVLIVGGGMIGCETAEFLATKGKKVTVLEMLGKMAADMGPTSRWRLLARLRAAEVRMESKTEVEEITDKGVKARHNGEPEFFTADSVVLAVGMKSNNSLAQELKETIGALHQIGDCFQPRKIGEAMQEGFRTGATV